MSIDVRTSIEKGGFLDKYLDFCAPKEFPESFGLFALLAAASCAVNGRIVVNPTTTPSPSTHIYAVLYGPSGSRKGAAIWTAVNLLGDAVPEAPVLPDDFNMESLTKYLADQSVEQHKCGGLVVSEEFSDLIGGAEYMKRNTQFLTRLYDARRQVTRLTIAHDLQTIENPYVVIAASSSPDWLEKVDPKALAGGFLRRLLLIVEYKRRQRVSSGFPDKDLYESLRKMMRDRLGPLAFRGGYMYLDPSARKLMDHWYEEGDCAKLEEHASERESHFVSCMQEHMLKLAALVNILEGRGPDTLEEASVRTAIGLLNAIVPGTFRAYASLVPTPYARLRAAINRIAQAAGEKGISESALDRAIVRTMGVKPTEALNARRQMQIDGDLRLTKKGRVVVEEE